MTDQTPEPVRDALTAPGGPGAGAVLSEADWPERDALAHEAAEAEAQDREHDEHGDPDATDPGDCEDPAELDPKPVLPADANDPLDDLDEGEDIGDVDLDDDPATIASADGASS